MNWYDKQLSFDDAPDNVDIRVLGEAMIKPGLIHASLKIKITMNDMTMAVLWKEKDVKVWPKHESLNVDEYMLAEKFKPWVDKLNPGNKFRPFMIRLVAKAKRGVSTWLMTVLPQIGR